jgi:hypothetical protein
LKPENVIYKLVGPVLLKQEQLEAKSNVDKRIEFIQSEMLVDKGGYRWNGCMLTKFPHPVFAQQKTSRRAAEGHQFAE